MRFPQKKKKHVLFTSALWPRLWSSQTSYSVFQKYCTMQKSAFWLAVAQCARWHFSHWNGQTLLKVNQNAQVNCKSSQKNSALKHTHKHTHFILGQNLPDVHKEWIRRNEIGRQFFLKGHCSYRPGTWQELYHHHRRLLRTNKNVLGIFLRALKWLFFSKLNLPCLGHLAMLNFKHSQYSSYLSTFMDNKIVWVFKAV